MRHIKSFSEIIEYINSQGQEIEVIIPAADSGSALAGVAAFVEAVSIPVQVRLIGNKENIEKTIADKGLREILNDNTVKMVSASGLEDAFRITLDMLDREKNQIILKGNSTSDQLMKGLLQQKEKILDTGNIISHMRLFEMPAGMVLMSDGGINVVSNISDREKRSNFLKKIEKNAQSFAEMLGIKGEEMFVPGEAFDISALQQMTVSPFADLSTFPRLIQFPWIGPANILYKAAASTPWRVVFDREISLSVPGALNCFMRTAVNKPLFIAAPEKGAGYKEKDNLLRSVLEKVREYGIPRPRVALLDFTEQYEAFSTTPSIVESRELIEKFGGEEAVIEGPMAFDLAVSEKASKIKKYDSKVSGKVDVLFIPDFTGGVLLTELYKHWDYLHLPWDAADLSFGGTVPILVPSRSDTPEHKLRSVVAAGLISLHTVPTHVG